jgi:hypothetical protein
MPTVRVNFLVTAAEQPMLAAALLSVPKGPRRSQRLAHLAVLGVMVEQMGVAGVLAASTGPGIRPPASAPGDGQPLEALEEGHFNDLFGALDGIKNL